MQALILAGGRGMHLSPLTDETPQTLLYLPGGPILEYLLHHLTLLPIERTALVLQYRGDQIARYLASRETLHLIPQYAPFTLCGALASATPWVEETTLVLHGDHYFSHDLRYFVQGAAPDRPTFLVSPADHEIGEPRRAGACLLPPEAFHIASQQVNLESMAAFYKALTRAGLEPTTFPMRGWATHIDTPTDLLTVNRYLLVHWHEAMHPPHAARGYDALNYNWISPDADVESAFQGLFVTIGPHTRVRRSQLYNALLLPGITVEDVSKQDMVLAGQGSSLITFYAPKA